MSFRFRLGSGEFSFSGTHNGWTSPYSLSNITR